MLKGIGKDGFGLDWPELILPRRPRGAARKKISVLTENQFGWNQHAEKCRKRWVPNSGSNWATPDDIPRFVWNGPGLGWPELILPRRLRRRGAQKGFCFDREWILRESACGKKWEETGLKFGVKLGHSW